MRYLPIFLDVAGRHIVVSGGGDAAVSKLRILLKTEATIMVFAAQVDPAIERWATDGLVDLVRRPLASEDLADAALLYGADEDPARDAEVATLGQAAGVPVNVVDTPGRSDFITPAMVDRDPVVVAIGTEGAAPVLARQIKKDLEERLPSQLGENVRTARSFRPSAEALPPGRARRRFWSEVFKTPGVTRDAIQSILDRHLEETEPSGRVDFVGAGPGDPEHLTLKARRLLDEADVVIHDGLVPDEILELARREAQMVDVAKIGFGPSTPQEHINRLLVEHAEGGALVVRLKAGDPTVFGRLDEEIEACEDAGVAWSVVPGITAASAAVASLGQSLTRRGRNSDVRFLTGHDAKGVAEHDWVALARPAQVAAIYMGKRASRYVQGRLLMHGADPTTPVSVVENAGRSSERILKTTIGRMEPDLSEATLKGPALILLGLAPRRADAALVRERAAV